MLNLWYFVSAVVLRLRGRAPWKEEYAVHITNCMVQVTYPDASQVVSSLDSSNPQTHTRPDAFLIRNLRPHQNAFDVSNLSVNSLFAGERESIVSYQYREDSLHTIHPLSKKNTPKQNDIYLDLSQRESLPKTRSRPIRKSQ